MPQQVQLMAKEDNLGLMPGLRPEGRRQTCNNKPRSEAIPATLPHLRGAMVWTKFSAGDDATIPIAASRVG